MHTVGLLAQPHLPPARKGKTKNLSLHELITDEFYSSDKETPEYGNISWTGDTIQRHRNQVHILKSDVPSFISLLTSSTHQFHKLHLLKICICHLFTIAHYILCQINLLNIPHILDIPSLHTVNISLTSKKLNQAPSATAFCTLNQYSYRWSISPSCGSQPFPVYRLIKQQSVFCGLICLTLYSTNNCLQI